MLVLGALATSIIIISFAAAGAMAAVAYRRNPAVQLWSLALFVHGVAYTLYLLRGEVSDVVAIVFPNIGIALTLALLGEGFGKFYQLPLRRLYLWAPVPLIAILFVLYLDNLTARLLISGPVFAAQSLLLISLMWRQRRHGSGRGQYIVITALSLLAGLLVMRTIATLAGQMGVLAGESNMVAHGATLLAGIASLTLMAIGLTLMVQERAEQALQRHRDELEQLVAVRTQQLALAKDAAEAASQAKSVFLMNISHELRTPMNAIMGMTELAMRRVSEPKVIDYLKKAGQSARHLLTLIDDLLDVARLADARLILDSVHFTLSTVQDRIGEHVQALAARKGLQVLIDFPDELAQLVLRGDPERLLQVLSKLSENAVKFTEAGKISLSVRQLEDRGTHAVLRFAVRDSGIGIAEADQQRIFGLFEQGDSSETRKYGGAGLGLNLSRQLVERMGGLLEVESEAGVGSTFSFTVPLEKAH